jgi:hypothetical protein
LYESRAVLPSTALPPFRSESPVRSPLPLPLLLLPFQKGSASVDASSIKCSLACQAGATKANASSLGPRAASSPFVHIQCPCNCILVDRPSLHPALRFLAPTNQPTNNERKLASRSETQRQYFCCCLSLSGLVCIERVRCPDQATAARSSVVEGRHVTLDGLHP